MNQVTEGALQLEEMVRGYEENLRALETRPAARSEEIYHRFMKGYYERALQALREGLPIVGSSGFIPAELFYALDLTPFLLEMHSCVVAAQGRATDYLDVGEGHYGISKEACSAHRVGVGLAKSGALPRPTFIVNTNLACDSIVKFSEILGTLYGCPTFPLDFAYGYEPSALEYNKQELAGLIRFLEEQSRQRLDPERLAEVLRLSQEAHDYCARISELRKAVPCPRSSKNSLRDMTVMRCGVGTAGAVDYFRAVYQETQQKVARGEGAIPQERYRIAWFFTMPFFDLEILDWMEREHGAVVVMDTLSYMPPDIPLDPSDPLAFLVNSPCPASWVKRFYGPARAAMLGDVTGICRDYRADAAICFAAWTCKQSCGSLRLAGDVLREELGLPMLVLDGDILDPRVVSLAQMKAKLAEFFAVLGCSRAGFTPEAYTFVST